MERPPLSPREALAVIDELPARLRTLCAAHPNVCLTLTAQQALYLAGRVELAGKAREMEDTAKAGLARMEQLRLYMSNDLAQITANAERCHSHLLRARRFYLATAAVLGVSAALCVVGLAN